MSGNQEYTFGSAEGVAAVIAAIPSRHPWRLIMLAQDASAVRAALTEAAENTCSSLGAGCPQGCWRVKTEGLAGELPATPRGRLTWVLEPNEISAIFQALVHA